MSYRSYRTTALLTEECIRAIEERKVAKGLTWNEMAKDLRISRNMLYKLTVRSRGTGAEIASRLSEYLDIPLHSVFSRPPTDPQGIPLPRQPAGT